MKNIEDMYVASPMQQGLIFHGLYAPESSAYSVQMICDLEGELEVAAFRRAWERVFQRYTILRTFFIWEGVKQVLQVVRREVNLPWREEDLRHLPEADQEARLLYLIEQERAARFNFSKAPLVRIVLVRLSERRAKFLWCHHHSLLDGWSAFRVFRDAFNCYEAYMRGDDPHLPNVRPYKDYIAWLQRQDISAAEQFWRQYLKGLVNSTPLTSERRALKNDAPYSKEAELQEHRERVYLSQGTTASLKEFARRHQLTMNTVIQGAWGILLSRYSGEEDVIFGTVVSGRPVELAGVEEMVGPFINLLPLRATVKAAASLTEWLRDLQEQQVNTRAFEYSPLVEVQGWSDVPRGEPFFESMTLFENFPISAPPSPAPEVRLRATQLNTIEKTTYPLTFEVVPGTELVLQLSYDYAFFTSEQTARMLRNVGKILEEMAAKPGARLRELSLLTQAERQQILVEWNATATSQPPALALHHLFERQVERSPDAIAVADSSQQLSFAALNARANQLAHALAARGVGPEAVVAILLPRTVQMLVAMLGIFKAGGAYLPLDPAYPRQRLNFMLADAGAALLLSQQDLAAIAAEAAAATLYLDSDWLSLAAQPTINRGWPGDGDNLAYLIYTSGSSGQPKGVGLSHANAASFLHWAHDAFPPSWLEGVLAATSICFDLSIFELFLPLSYGGRILLCDNLLGLPEMAAREQVTLINSVPSVIEELLNLGGLPRSVETVNLAGEALPGRLVKRLAASAAARFYNLYGPTETTTYSSYAAVSGESQESPTIGRPTANTAIYILDEEQEAVPVGVVGELYIGGPTVARGYLKRPEMTAEKFMANGYGKRGGERMYRTGDLARYRAEGEIEYLGRKDQQVKVRGYRIEMGEIEEEMRQHEGVEQAVVGVREGEGGGVQLVAYVVSKGGKLSSKELREHLKARMPEYMVPQRYVEVEELPQTPNGKLDRQGLAKLEGLGELSVAAADAFVAPQSPTQEILANLWCSILGVSQVAVDDNFFELGGHSLLATQVISRVRQIFAVELPLRRLFEYPRLAQFSRLLDDTIRTSQGVCLQPIQAAPRSAALPLSFAQQRLWFLHQLAPHDTAYNMPLALRVSGALKLEALEQALSEIVRRHEGLRSRFVDPEGVPEQVIDAATAFDLKVSDLREIADNEQEAARQVRLEAEAAFDLAAGGLLRVRLLRLAESEHLLTLVMHHIISDGWSMGVLLSEMAALYNAYAARQESPLEELAIQYADYAVWQRDWLQGDVLEQQLDYWKKQLAGPSVLELPTDRVRPAVSSHKGSSVSLRISQEVSEGLRRLCLREGATMFMALLAAFDVLLNRYTGQREIRIGTPIANRNMKEIEGLIGFFLNTLVLNINIEQEPSFQELLATVRKIALDAFAHQQLPFEKLVEEMQPERSLSASPLFQVMFVLQHASKNGSGLQGLTLTQVNVVNTTSKFDLTLSLQQRGNDLAGLFEYDAELFDRSTVERMAESFLILLENIVRAPQQQISLLPILSSAAQHQLLVEWNETLREDTFSYCVTEIFDRQARLNPDSIAAIFENEQASYEKLDQMAGQLARHLQSLGAGPEVSVAICMERSLEMAIALLGVLKSGAAYLPLDIAYPGERLAFMLADAQVPIVLTQQHLVQKLPEHDAKIICLDGIKQQSDSGMNWQAPFEGNLQSHAVAENKAYVIYTSGSTGVPKGVALPHRALTNLIEWHKATMLGGVKVLQYASLSFDASFHEFFAAWSTGGAIVLIPDEFRFDIGALLHYIREKEIEKAILPVVVLQEMAEMHARGNDALSGVKEITTTGEQLQITTAIIDLFSDLDHCRLYNHYGPSESHVVTSFELAGEPRLWLRHPSIGTPIYNTQLYVLDSRMGPLPVGVYGELYIGGVCLAQGYMGRPELTAEKFIPNPFAAEPGARLYRTGDLVRYQGVGSLDYQGRIDHQVKLRGFRIELGEIEAILSCNPAVKETVVLAREDQIDRKQLVAYVVADPDVAVSSTELRRFLAERLPDYMLPSAFVFLDRLPLTNNGKIDRRALPAPDITQNAEGQIKPENAVEEIVAGIWQEVLKVAAVGAEDNFFELGGHSLLATQVISRVRQIFAVELPLRRLFEYPRLSQFSRLLDDTIRTSQGVCLQPIQAAPRSAALPLSFAQQRLWFLHQLALHDTAYNMPLALRVSGALKLEALEQALSEIVRRHEGLRSRFVDPEGVPEQVIDAATAFELAVSDLQEVADNEQEAARQVRREAEAAFDLAAGGLLRVKLLRLAEAEYILTLVMHHIISDGWSMGVLLSEMAGLYNAYAAKQESPLEELAIQYADYAVWQRDWLQGDVLQKQLSYWRNHLQGMPAALELPLDKQRPAVQTSNGATHAFTIPAQLAHSLNALCRQQSVTLFMATLSAFQTLLHRYNGQPEIAVGTPIAGRNLAETEALIGLFINMLVLRSDFNGNPSFTDLLGRTREVCLGAYAHQDIPFEKLVEEIQPPRDLSRTPLFQVMFMLQNRSLTEIDLNDLTLRTFDTGTPPAKFDITFLVTDSGQDFKAVISYNTDLFDDSTIERMAGHYLTLLESLVSHPTLPVSRLQILEQAERQQILVEWNAKATSQPPPLALHHLFERQVERSPDAIAVADSSQQLSFAALNARANQLAHALAARGIGPEAVVAILLPRTVQMLVAMLGIFKAGGAYLPLDPAYPRQRLNFMLADAGAALLLSQQDLAAIAAEAAAATLYLDSDWLSLAAQPTTNRGWPGDGDNLAYLIYTSGSSGQPKGVGLSHANAASFLHWAHDAFPPSWLDGVLAATSICFDLSIFELFLPLSYGGRILLCDNLLGLPEMAAREQVTLINSVPSVIEELLNLGGLPGSVETVNLAGEALPGRLVKRLAASAAASRFYNLYGPTETTTYSSYTAVSGESQESPTIGRPTANTAIYILDEEQEAVPVGVVGELYIGGPTVARGYLKRPEMTAEKFMANGYGKRGGERMYRTGDLARYRVEGEIEYLGRKDQQVKVRGYRIEMGEIEEEMRQHGGVEQAVVGVREGEGGGVQLVAYVVSKGGKLSSKELREHLKARMPEYMVPQRYVEVEEMPQTPNGKLDRQGLAKLEGLGEMGVAAADAFVAPRDWLEFKLAQVWEDLLGVRPIGVTDDFFVLGGHSLLAVRLMAQVEKQFGRRLPLATLFEGSTISYLAGLLRQQDVVKPESSLIPMQPSGARPPLFFVHPVGGQVYCYMELSRHLGVDQPFYGLQTLVTETGPAHLDIEAMAAHYLDEVRLVQPEGPYSIGGWSMGGVVAFQMAQQLQAQGQEVKLLALVDSVLPRMNGAAPLQNKSDEDHQDTLLLMNFIQDLGFPPDGISALYNRLLQVEPEQRLGYVLDQACGAGVVPKGLEIGVFRSMYEMFNINFRALLSYRPQPYQGSGILFTAQERMTANDFGSAQGWDEIIKDLQIKPISGNHYTIVRAPHVRVLAEEIRAYCDHLNQEPITASPRRRAHHEH